MTELLARVVSILIAAGPCTVRSLANELSLSVSATQAMLDRGVRQGVLGKKPRSNEVKTSWLYWSKQVPVEEVTT